MKKTLFKYTVILFLILLYRGDFLIAQSSVKIGTRIWTTNNLNVDKFSNGNAIKQAKTVEEWSSTEFDSENAWGISISFSDDFSCECHWRRTSPSAARCIKN